MEHYISKVKDGHLAVISAVFAMMHKADDTVANLSVQCFLTRIRPVQCMKIQMIPVARYRIALVM